MPCPVRSRRQIRWRSAPRERRNRRRARAEIADHVTTNTLAGINIDMTPPGITLASRTPANAAGWNNSGVSVVWNCTDGLSGPGSLSVSDSRSSEGAGQTVTGACVDLAGNSASATESGISIDKTAPTLNPTISPTPIVLGGSATVAAGAVDTLSGVASQSCEPLDTSSMGTKSLTCSATDHAGNSATSVVSYVVTYGTFSTIGPANAWIGLKNSDDVGTKFDLLVEVLKNGVVVTSGQLNSVPGGSSGFNNAVLRQVVSMLSSPNNFAQGDTLAVRLSARIAVNVAGHSSGTARLWYGDGGANSRVDTVVNGAPKSFYLANGFQMSPVAGSLRSTVDCTCQQEPEWQRVQAVRHVEHYVLAIAQSGLPARK